MLAEASAKDPTEAILAARRAESARHVGALTRMTRDVELDDVSVVPVHLTPSCRHLTVAWGHIQTCSATTLEQGMPQVLLSGGRRRP